MIEISYIACGVYVHSIDKHDNCNLENFQIWNVSVID